MTTFTVFADAQKEVLQKMGKIFLDTGVKLFDNIIWDSPVGDPRLWKSKAPEGYVGGNFRGNWQASVGAPITTELYGATDRTQDVKITLKSAKITDTLYLANNTAYAEPIELGWSSQRPSGWVRTRVMQAQQFLDAEIAKQGAK